MGVFCLCSTGEPSDEAGPTSASSSSTIAPSALLISSTCNNFPELCRNSSVCYHLLCCFLVGGFRKCDPFFAFSFSQFTVLQVSCWPPASAFLLFFSSVIRPVTCFNFFSGFVLPINSSELPQDSKQGLSYPGPHHPSLIFLFPLTTHLLPFGLRKPCCSFTWKVPTYS